MDFILLYEKKRAIPKTSPLSLGEGLGVRGVVGLCGAER